MDGDGGFAVEMASLIILVVAAAVWIAIYFGLFTLSRSLYRKNKILVLALWIPAFPSLFWVIFNLSLQGLMPYVREALFRLLLLTPFFDTYLLSIRFPIPMMLYFVIAYGSLIFRYLQLRHKDLGFMECWRLDYMSMNDGGGITELAMLWVFILCIVGALIIVYNFASGVLSFVLCVLGGIVILYGLVRFTLSLKQDKEDEKLTEEEDDKLIH